LVDKSSKSTRLRAEALAPSTIRHADKIVVLDRGRIVQMGRFDELMQQEGPFHALAKRQTV